MKIELSHVVDFQEEGIDIHLYASTEDDGYYFEKKFGLTKENGKFLVIHVFKKAVFSNTKGKYEYPYPANIEGTIFDSTGEVETVPKEIFTEDIINEVNEYLKKNEEKWISLIEK